MDWGVHSLSISKYFPFCNSQRESFFDTYAKLTLEQLDWQAPGSKNSIGFCLRHIAQSEDWFVNYIILGREVPLKRRAELPTITEILDYLRETRNNTMDLLNTLDESELPSLRTLGEGFRGNARETTVHWILNRIFEHESYHYGQVNLMMKQQDIEPPNL